MRLRCMLVAVVMLGSAVGCGQPTDNNAASTAEPTGIAAAVPPELQRGAELFDSNCAICHGVGAKGTDKGPTFLDPTYRPGHHPDQAFHLAATAGVRAHHWQFGNMPPVQGVTQEQVAEITAYIRWLQRQNGIE